MHQTPLHTLGSAVFLLASILFHPRFSAAPRLYSTAVCGFVVGSMLFAAAGARGLWGASPARARGGDGPGVCAINFAGSLLWLVGSVAFWPDPDALGPVFGTYSFGLGSVAYVCSSGWNLKAAWPTVARLRRWDKAVILQMVVLAAYTAGALGFIVGDLDDLSEDPREASVCWIFGSVMFLLGSMVPSTRPEPASAARDERGNAVTAASSRRYRLPHPFR